MQAKLVIICEDRLLFTTSSTNNAFKHWKCSYLSSLSPVTWKLHEWCGKRNNHKIRLKVRNHYCSATENTLYVYELNELRFLRKNSLGMRRWVLLSVLLPKTFAESEQTIGWLSQRQSKSVNFGRLKIPAESQLHFLGNLLGEDVHS